MGRLRQTPTAAPLRWTATCRCGSALTHPPNATQRRWWPSPSTRSRCGWSITKSFNPAGVSPSTLNEWSKARCWIGASSRYKVKTVVYDPYQMASTSQRMMVEGLPMEEFPQTSGNLTEMSSNLFELVMGRNLQLYPSEEMRLAVARAVAVEGTRGWKIAKEKASHKIDVAVGLAMAAHAAVTAHKTKPQRIRISTYAAPYSTGPFHHTSNKVGELRSAANNGCVPGKGINTKTLASKESLTMTSTLLKTTPCSRRCARKG